MSQVSHGLMLGLVSADDIRMADRCCQDVLANEAYWDTLYVPDMHRRAKGLHSLADKVLHKHARALLGTDCVSLECIELHRLSPRLDHITIPMHQDAFYHAIRGNQGVKFLMPFGTMTQTNGALSFLDVPRDMETVEHVASTTRHFSSEVKDRARLLGEFSSTTYNYSPGDVSYHYLSSIHFYDGVYDGGDTVFLVFRYQDMCAHVDENILSLYGEICRKQQ